MSAQPSRAVPPGPDSPGAMYAAARMYYDEDANQQTIAERLGVSRSTVSRLLRSARECGIVRIEVRAPSDLVVASAEAAEALGLRRVVVVPASAAARALHALVEPAAAELERLALRAGDVLAVSWGDAVATVAQSPRLPALRGVRIVPAVGAMDEPEARFQTNEIARRMAHATGAEVVLLPVPALPGEALRRSLRRDAAIAARLALWDDLAAVLVGIGAPPLGSRTGATHVDAHRERLAGAVGDVVSRHFDLQGRPVTFPGEERLLGVSWAQLRGAGTVVAVAAGAPKVPSVVGAARSGLIDVLVTDATTASAAVELARRAA
jgi:DNA-binding transcriptional regulator LsrR (DeoR family)